MVTPSLPTSLCLQPVCLTLTASLIARAISPPDNPPDNDVRAPGPPHHQSVLSGTKGISDIANFIDKTQLKGVIFMLYLIYY